MPLSTPALDQADLAACRALLNGGSRTFAAAARVLPRRIHTPATALYAFCRVADDAIDADGGGESALAVLHERLDRAYAARPADDPVDRALAWVVRAHDLPRAPLDGLLEGFAWDAQGRGYETLDELHAYATRVAGTVGAMMAVLMEARAPHVVARACDLGIAMQLTNIARDVGEDARAGRLYLPRAWLREAGIEPDAWLRAPAFSEALASVVQRLLNAADLLYVRADAGIAKLPLDCRPGIGAARLMYAEIGRAVERQGCDSVARRAVVPGSRKAALLAASLARLAMPFSTSWAPALPQAQFLVDAIAATRQQGRSPDLRWRAFDARVAWLVTLFAQLEERDRATGRA